MPEVADVPFAPALDAPSGASVARALLEAGAITVTPDAPVTFASGIRSPVYVDNRRLISAPDAWHVVIEAFTRRLAHAGRATVIAGVEAAGIPHSSALAYALRLPSVFVRKAAKVHGLGRRIEGGDVAGRHVVLVEDMVTTGGSSLSAVEALREAGATVERCEAIVTYGFDGLAERFEAASVTLSTLTTFDVILDEGLAWGRLGERDVASVRDWLADPRGWTAP